MVVVLYLSGMSLAAVRLVMEQLLDMPISGTEVYYILQRSGEAVAQAVGAQVLVTDDADSWKGVADDLGIAHQVCVSHLVWYCIAVGRGLEVFVWTARTTAVSG